MLALYFCFLSRHGSNVEVALRMLTVCAALHTGGHDKPPQDPEQVLHSVTATLLAERSLSRVELARYLE